MMYLSGRTAKVLNDLWGNKTSTLLNVLSIAVGLFAIGTILNSRVILENDLTVGYAAINPSTGTLHTVQPFFQDFLDTVRKRDDVVEADARRALRLRIQVADGARKNLQVYAYDNFDDINVNKITPQQGAWPPERHEILLERSSLDYLGLKVGDALLVETGEQKLARLVISGSVHDLSQPPSTMMGSPYGYMTMETAEWLGESQGFNELNIVAVGGRSKDVAKQVLNEIKTKAEKSGYTIPLSMHGDPGQFPLNDVVQSILMLMALLGVMTLFLSVFLIINTVTSLMAEQMRQIGIMKAIGANTRQIMVMYLSMVIFYGVLALVLAIPGGIIGASLLSEFMASMFNFDLITALDPNPTTIVVQVAIGLLLPVLASIVPFLTGLRVTAAEAMSGMGAQKGGPRHGWIDRLISGANLWFARNVITRPIVLSLRNTFRRKGRLVLTMITLTTAGMIFISVSNVRNSLSYTIDDLMKGRLFDIFLNFTQSQRMDRVIRQAEQVPGVVKAEAALNLTARRVRPDGSESGTIVMQGMKPDSEIFASPSMVSGRWLDARDENALIVNSYMIDDEASEGAPIHIGDTVTLKINGKESQWRIVGVAMGAMSSAMLTDYTSAARATGNVGRTSTLVILSDRHERAYANQIARNLEEYFKTLKTQVDTVMTIQDMKAQFENAFGIIISLLLVMSVLLAIVGGLGLMGTMSINVIERTREVGVMRAIGSSGGGVELVFTREGFIIAGLSWVLGLILSFPFTSAVTRILGLYLLKFPLKPAYSWTGIIAWLLLIIVLSALANFLPARNASRLTVREVLAYE